jgi:alkaline phosphatase D
MLGDNIYADTSNIAVLRQQYRKLADNAGFRELRQKIQVLATWDDHDFGANDAGAEFAAKEGSEKAFLDFLGEPQHSVRRQRPGVYASYLFGQDNQRIQIILLDTRYFRTALTQRPASKEKLKPFERNEMITGHYLANHDLKATILGSAQWTWLEEQFKVPADIRILASSIQVLAEFTGFEAWANFPKERERLFQLMRKHQVNNAIILSGDAHLGEISIVPQEELGQLVEITSSGLTHATDRSPTNMHRISPAILEKNFGSITIYWSKNPVEATSAIHSIDGVVRLSHTWRVSE